MPPEPAPLLAWTVYHDPEAAPDAGWFVAALQLFDPGRPGPKFMVRDLGHARYVIREMDPGADFRMDRLASDPVAVVETWI